MFVYTDFIDSMIIEATSLMCTKVEIESIGPNDYTLRKTFWASVNFPLFINGNQSRIESINGNIITVSSFYPTVKKCNLGTIDIPNQYEDKTIQELLLGLNINGYNHFIWTYPILETKNQQLYSKYQIFVGFPYEHGKEDYKYYLLAAKEYLLEWLNGLNRCAKYIIKNISEIRTYPFVDSLHSDSKLISKLPCSYAGASAQIDIIL